jgi:hypothetical protein
MGKNQDLGSGINIPDPQHWSELVWGGGGGGLLEGCGNKGNFILVV